MASDCRKRKHPGNVEEARDGFYWRQSRELRRAIIELARRERLDAVKQDRADRRAHDDEKLARREEAVQRTLESVVDRFAAAKEFYDQWAAQGARDTKQLDEQLKGRSLTDQIGELRRQIEMRTLGLGWTQVSRATAARAPPSPRPTRSPRLALASLRAVLDEMGLLRRREAADARPAASDARR